MKDPYTTLGLHSSATDDEIKKAYRKLALEFHPDRNNGDDEKFKEISNAYEIINDPIKRSKLKLDSSMENVFNDDMFSEFFRHNSFADNFNTAYNWNQNTKGVNVTSQIHITLDEAYFGVKREVRLGLKSISVTIQPGIINGQRLRLKGLGQKGTRDELNGDLILTIIILDHLDYMIDNKGLHKIHKICVFDAILGGKSFINIFDKKINFTIPQGTQNGTMLRIQGKGFPIYNKLDKFSDLYINVLIELPKNLNENELLLIADVKKALDERNEFKN
jgi:curved DNA-binding protein